MKKSEKVKALKSFINDAEVNCGSSDFINFLNSELKEEQQNEK